MMQLAATYVDQILIYIVFVASLNLLLGYAGQASLAHAAFGAVGGYALGYLFLNAHLGGIEGVIVAAIGGGIAGVIVGLPALRLTTEWVILLTLAVETIIVTLVTTFNALGGTYGLQSIAGIRVLGTKLEDPLQMLPFFLVVTAIVFAVCWRLGESPYGRVLRGIREDEIATRALGKNVYGYKLTVFGVTAAMAGVGGALLVIDNTVASPQLFGFDQSSAMVAMVVVGGAGSLWGSLAGVAVLVLLGPLFQSVLNIGEEATFFWRLIAYGIVLLVMVMVRPQGLFPDRITRRLGKAMKKLAAAPPALPAVVAPVGDPVTLSLSKGAPVLKVTGLSKHFGGIVAADNLDMELYAGTITALVGPNGAGKTTVFNLLTGAIKPDAGTVTLNGRDITGLRPNAIARLGMARSFQNVRIFPRLSVLENVMLGIQDQCGEYAGPLFLQPMRVARAEKATEEKAREWLRFVGMDNHADLPAGALAFGQQKLVALARVLATEADVLLLDEPASGIDQQWVDVMLGLIDQVRRRGRTVCIVEHNLHVVDRLADHTYFMELGRITAQGDFGELTADRRLAEAYFGTA